MAKRFDSTKVVRLPTAAKRKVQQPCNNAAREARWHLREQQRHHFDYVLPSIREAEARIRALDTMPDTPAVNIVRNIVRELGSEDCQRVLGIIRCGLQHDDPFAKDVEAVMRSVCGTTIGEHSDFKQALVRLQLASE